MVTGAASGIGAAVAERFVMEGARVVAGDLDETAVGRVAARIGPSAVPQQVDVCDEDAVVRLMDTAMGSGGLDVLVNVAGIGATTSAPDTPLEVWDRVMDVNARGTFLCCKHAIPIMAGAEGGSIVNMASIAGLVGLPRRAAYCASKGAVIALTRALAVDHVGDGIRVNCVCPGTVDSPWVRRLIEESGESLDDLRRRQPMGRLGRPEEIAEAALYLASDSAAFATGSILTLDGGLTAR